MKNNRATNQEFVDGVYAKVFLRLLPFLVICFVLANIDRSNVAFAKLQFQATLGFSESIYGIGVSVFALGYLLFEIPSNIWLKRVGIRKTLLRIMMAWGFFCVLLAFMQTEWHFYTLRFLLGVAEAGFFPGVMYYLSKWVPESRRAQALAIFTGSMGIAGTISGPLAGVIMSGMDNRLGLEGWQWLFILEGMPAMALGVIAYFYLDESPADAKWLTEEERELVIADLSENEPLPGEQSGKSLVSCIFSRNFIGLVVAGFAMFHGIVAFFFWMPSIFKSLGVNSIMQIGLYSSVPFVAGILLQYLNGKSSDKRGERKAHISIGLAIAGSTWILLGLLDPAPLLGMFLLVVIVAGNMSATGPYWSLPPAILPPEHRAVGIAIATTAGGVAAFFQPIFAGLIIDATSNINYSHFFNGGFILACVLGFQFLYRKEAN